MSKLSIGGSIIQTNAIFKSDGYWLEDGNLQNLAFYILDTRTVK